MISIFKYFRILTRLVVNQLGHEQNLLIVPKTACLTSLILQQYKNGFKDELIKVKEGCTYNKDFIGKTIIVYI